MARFIKADDLIATIRRWLDSGKYQWETVNALNCVIIEIEDADEPVHCGDCVCYDAGNQMCMDLYGFGRRWQPTDFCSYGRKQDESDQQRDFNSRV